MYFEQGLSELQVGLTIEMSNTLPTELKDFVHNPKVTHHSPIKANFTSFRVNLGGFESIKLNEYKCNIAAPHHKIRQGQQHTNDDNYVFLNKT